MIDLSVEYAHIYADRSFSIETAASAALLRERLADADASRQLLVLVDDYSPAVADDFDYAAFLARLGHHGAAPDLIVRESALLAHNHLTLAALGERRVGRQLRRYVAAHERHPCSLFVATWYLIRLGWLPGGFPGVTPARTLLNILPSRFREFEDRAADIIATLAGRDTLARVETVFFDPPADAPDAPLWDRFDPEAYLFNNYTTLLPADLYTLAATYRRYRARAPISRALELGTGPGLLPILAMLPSCDRIVIVEPGDRNLSYLVRQSHAFDPAWDAPIAALRLLDPALEHFDFARAYRQRVGVLQGDDRDLPRAEFDAVSMHYVAESATRDPREFVRICGNLARAARPGALVSAAFMEGSDGYTVDGVAFPALRVDSPAVLSAFGPLLADHAIDRLDASSGPARHGYTGHLLLAATRSTWEAR